MRLSCEMCLNICSQVMKVWRRGAKRKARAGHRLMLKVRRCPMTAGICVVSEMSHSIFVRFFSQDNKSLQADVCDFQVILTKTKNNNTKKNKKKKQKETTTMQTMSNLFYRLHDDIVKLTHGCNGIWSN